MKNKTISALAVLFSGWIFFQACKHEIPVAGKFADTTGVSIVPFVPGISGKTCSADTVYFANYIQPLMNANCAMSGCHDAVTHAEGINLSTYTGIMRIVSPGKAGSSKLYAVIKSTGSNRMPPPPKPAFTADQLAKVQTWINQGALNNVCDACDTANFKFSAAILPMLQNKCIGCHNTASLGGGIDLSTYNAVKAVALNGKLYGSVNWSPGFSAMPKGGIKSPDCEIRQVKKWIDSGTPNN
ncbi:MAG: hypothetical protein RLZZ28_2430 [Bacteroidota bacterium]